MIPKEVKELIDKAVKLQLDETYKIYGDRFYSENEELGVIVEEKTEVEEEYELYKECLIKYVTVFNLNTELRNKCLEQVREYALNTIYELIQVVSCIDKKENGYIKDYKG